MNVKIAAAVMILLLVCGLALTASRSPQTLVIDERSPNLEADILPDKNRYVRMVLRDNQRLWVGGNMSYRLDFDADSNIYVRDVINTAIDKINEVGCVHISPAGDATTDYVSFRLGANYSSQIGRQGGVQVLTVDPDTIHVGSVIHQLMHALGFGHEHNRPDRDLYVTVDFSNIKEEAKHLFTKYTPDSGFEGEVDEYDYTSIMHATGAYYEEINIDISKPVIWRNDGELELGQRSMLTDLDKLRLKVTYSCDVCIPPENNGLLFRYPGDCTKFIECSNTFPFVFDCPDDLHYSRAGNKCDYPYLANCTA